MIFIRVHIVTMLSFPKELWPNVPPFENHSIIYHELIEDYVDIIRYSIWGCFWIIILVNYWLLITCDILCSGIIQTIVNTTDLQNPHNGVGKHDVQRC